MSSAVAAEAGAAVEWLFTPGPVIAVVAIEDAADAVPLASALVRGGIPTIEITLRTATALESIGAVAASVPDAVVGAGTVTSAAAVRAAADAGARFLVSPGTTPRLLEAFVDSGLPFLPGAATASEVVGLLERGVEVAKLFPAEAAGGVALLRSFAGPFPSVRFCPTGGITRERAQEYLALGNVIGVGGSWMVPAPAVRARDWETIEALAADAASLGQLGQALDPHGHRPDRPGAGS